MLNSFSEQVVNSGDRLSMGLDSFRLEYARRVLALMERDYERAAVALDMPDDELKALVGSGSAE